MSRMMSSESVSLPHLPLELVDLIIKSIDPRDKRGLCVCGLVCHTWLRLSRPILFRSISLHVAYMQSNAHAYSKLFRRPERTTFKDYVEEIVLVGVHPWTRTVLPRLMHHLTAFSTLRLSELRTDTFHLHFSVPEARCFPLLPAFNNLVQLIIEIRPVQWAQQPDLRSILGFLCALPMLEHFSLACATKSLLMSRLPPLREPEFVPLQRLNTVELNYDSSGRALCWIMDNITPAPPITTLTLVCRSDLNRLYECIHAVSATLRHLTLVFPDAELNPPYPADKLVPLAPHLHTLRLCAEHTGLISFAASLLSAVNFRTRGPEELMLEYGDGDLVANVNGDAVTVAQGEDDQIVDPMALAALDRACHGLPRLAAILIRTPPPWKVALSLPLCSAADLKSC
ncbi:hypothetical protein C8R43DRAFT_974868 [Mycena crocata]|nr:hypothetical protein C8R43DRAFT_974868 [Mycena crocata]